MAGIGFDWSRAWNGDDVAILLSEKQQQLLLFLMQAVNVNPDYYISDFDESDLEDINDFTSLTIARLMGLPVPINGSNEVTLWGTEAVVQGGGSALARAVLSTQFHNLIVAPTTPAINWKVRWDRFLTAGTWDYSFLWRRTTNSGIIDVYATPDSGGTVVVINDLDMRGTDALNQRTTGTFTLTKSELYHIELEVVGTSSGANYSANFTNLQLWKSG